MIKICFILLIGIVLSPAMSFGAFQLELKGGVPFNFRTPLYYWEEGDSEVTRHSAQYSSQPFEEAPYYIIRLSLSDEDENQWELELIHHKIILNNVPSAFQSFNISHGYNFLVINHAWKTKYFTWRVGGGIILAHPEITTDEGNQVPYVEGTLVGFYVAGFGIQGAIERKWFFGDHFFIAPEIKLTLAQAQVDFFQGWANAPNIAIHLTFGLGYRF